MGSGLQALAVCIPAAFIFDGHVAPVALVGAIAVAASVVCAWRWWFEANESGIVLRGVRCRRIEWSAITRIGWASANGHTDPTRRPWLTQVWGPSLFITYPALAFECGRQLYVVDQTIGLEVRTRSSWSRHSLCTPPSTASRSRSPRTISRSQRIAPGGQGRRLRTSTRIWPTGRPSAAGSAFRLASQTDGRSRGRCRG